MTSLQILDKSISKDLVELIIEYYLDSEKYIFKDKYQRLLFKFISN